MPVRSVIAALCAAGLVVTGVSACTGDDTSGSPLPTSSVDAATSDAASDNPSAAPASGSGSTSSPSASTSSGTAAATAVTGFRRLWTWQVLPPDKTGFGLHVFDDAVLDGDRLVWVDVVRKDSIGIVGSTSHLVSADLATRKVVWSHTIKGEPDLLKVAGGTVLLSMSVDIDNGKGTSPLYAYAADSGKALWHKAVVPGVAVVDRSVIVTTKGGGTFATSRVDAATGRSSATSTTPSGPLVGASGDRVVFGSNGQVVATDAALKQVWRAGSVRPAVTDTSVVGDAVITWSEFKGRQDMVAYDLDTGRRRWHKQVTLDSDVVSDSVVDGRLLLRTDAALVAFAADGTSWTVPEGAVQHVGAGPVAGNPVGCGQTLVSLTADGRLDAHTDLPSQFSNAPCKVAPSVTGPDAALPNVAVVVGDTAVVAYRTTSGTPKPTRADGTGRWGAVSPAACPGGSAHALARALDGSFGPRWYVVTVDHGQCELRSNDGFPFALAGTLSSAAKAKRFVNPRAADGGCKVKGWTGGKAATVPSAGLPAGSGICSLTGSRSGAKPEPDLYAGATRTHDGRWLSVLLVYPSNKGADFAGAEKMLAVLRRLAA